MRTRLVRLCATIFSAMTIAPDADALDALRQMQRGGVTCLLVMDEGRLVGIVSLKDLLKFLNLKLQLEGPGDSVGSSGDEPSAPPADHITRSPGGS